MKISSFKIHFWGAIFGRSASVVRPEEERVPMRVFCRHSSILSENDRNNSRKAVHPSDFRGHMLKKSRNADFGDFWWKLKEGSHHLMLVSINLHHNSRAEKHQSIWFRNIDFSYGTLSSSGRTSASRRRRWTVAKINISKSYRVMLFCSWVVMYN